MATGKKKIPFLLLASLVAIIWLAPYVMSSNLALRFLLATIGRSLPGTLTVDSWSINWLEGFEAKNVSYHDPKKNIKFKIVAVTTSKGIIALMAAPSNIGLLTLEQPTVEKILYSAPATPQKASSGPAKRDNEPAATSDETPFWDELAAKLAIKNGTIIFSQHNVAPRALAQKITLEASLAQGTIDFTASLAAPTGQGQMTLAGFINLPTRYSGLAEALISRTELTLIDIPLASFMTLLPQTIKPPQAQGAVTGSGKITINGLNEIRLAATTTLTAGSMHGGFLGEDLPKLANATLSLDIHGNFEKGWQLAQLDIESEPTKIHTQGHFAETGSSMHCRGTMSLPSLCMSLPNTLKIKPTTRVKSGILDFDLDVGQGEQETRLTLKSTIERLSGSANDRPFIWNPLTLQLQGEKKSESNISISALELESSFMQVRGKGDLHSLKLTGSADLGQSFSELGNIFMLNWSGTGKLEFTLTSTRQEKNADLLNARLAIADFSLQRDGEQILPKHTFSLNGDIHSFLSLVRAHDHAGETQLTISSWPGDVSLRADQINKIGDNYSLRYRLSAQLDLDKTTTLLHALQLLPLQRAFGGALQLRATGFLDQSNLILRELDGSIVDFSLHQPGTTIREPQLRLQLKPPTQKAAVPVALRPLDVYESAADFSQAATGLTGLDFATHQLITHGLLLTSQVGTVEAEELIINNWQHPLAKFSANILFDGQLRNLVDILHDTGEFPPEISVSGNAKGVFNSASMNNGYQPLNANLEIVDLNVAIQDKLLLKDEKVSGEFTGQGVQQFAELIIKQLQLRAQPLSLTASGILNRKPPQKIFELQGDFTPDLEKLEPLLSYVLEDPVQIRGHKKQPFRISYPLAATTAAEQLRQLQLAGNLCADQLTYKGLAIEQLDIPLNMEKGLLRTKVTGLVNGGRLYLEPQISYVTSPPLLTNLSKDQRIISDVELEKELVEGVLAKIHPFFGTLTTPRGLLDIRLSDISWPASTSASHSGAFAMVLDFSKITLDYSPFFRGLLKHIGLAAKPLNLQESLIECNAHNGTITCSPITIMIADSALVLSGSTNFDQTLDYTLQLPVTKKLAGKKYKSVAGTTIALPITGSVDDPAYDRHALSATVAGLLKQAAGKVKKKRRGSR